MKQSLFYKSLHYADVTIYHQTKIKYYDDILIVTLTLKRAT